MSYSYREWVIPARMLDALLDYIQHGAPTGDFLRAVIENDLRGAVGHADDENIRNLPAYVVYLYNEAPHGCWGSPEKRMAWVEARALDDR